MNNTMNAGMAQNETEDRRRETLYLLHLLACGLRGKPACAAPAGLDWARLDKLAVHNSVQNLARFGVKTVLDAPAELRAAWELSAKQVLYKHAMFDIEREAVMAQLAERGLACLPLKGVHIRGYYPRPEMRSFCDNDILYGFVEPCPGGGYQIRGATEAERERSIAQATKASVEVMVARGYEVECEGRGNHESFLKKPFYNFELHRSLVSRTSSLYAYYENPWKRAVPVEGSSTTFRFEDEDEYLFFVVHAFKHFDTSGCGVRCVADEWAFLDRKGSSMDWKRIERELSIMGEGLTAFEASLRGLARAAFGEPGMLDADYRNVLTPEQEAMVLFMLGAGTYGTVAINVERKLNKLDARGAGKFAYVRDRVFMPEDQMREAYPTFYQHKVLRPVLPLFRAAKGLVTNRSRLLAELRSIVKWSSK